MEDEDQWRKKKPMHGSRYLVVCVCPSSGHRTTSHPRLHGWGRGAKGIGAGRSYFLVRSIHVSRERKKESAQ